MSDDVGKRLSIAKDIIGTDDTSSDFFDAFDGIQPLLTHDALDTLLDRVNEYESGPVGGPTINAAQDALATLHEFFFGDGPCFTCDQYLAKGVE